MSKCDDAVRSDENEWSGHQNDIPGIKENVSLKFSDMTAKTQFFWNIVKVYPTNSEKCFWNFEPHQFCYLSSSKNSKHSSFWLSLAR